MHKEDSEFTGHEACPACGSSDALARYSDGHGFCFACQHYAPGEGSPAQPKRSNRMQGLLTGEVRALASRGLSEATCRRYSYLVGKDRDGRACQIAQFRDASGAIIAQKVRYADKTFAVVGEGKSLPLFGAHLAREGGKRIVITEGEIDAMSVSQVFNNQWPVVSVPNGAQSAAKAIKANLDWLSKYETVVLCFDMDDAGRKATEECAPLFPPGRCALAALPRKDANEMLVANEGRALVSAIYEATTFRPGGIINGKDTWDLMVKATEPGWSLPRAFAGLDRMIMGLHPRTLVTLTSGSGQGKSTAASEFAYHLLTTHKLTVGYVALEESVGRTAQRFVGLHVNKPIHLPTTEVDEATKRRAFDETLGTGRLWVHDHWGSTTEDDLMSKLRYLAVGCGCQVLVLDHLSIVVSGMVDDLDERKLIDKLMTQLRSMVEETGVLLILVSHLRSADGEKTHEEGGRVKLAQLRGSRAIGQLSDCVIGLERDQQSEAEANVLTIRVLKDRLTGNTGPACRVAYNKETGRLEPGDDFCDETKTSGASDF